MPEGHKTHFFAREHTAWFAGQTLEVTSPQGRFRNDARKISGKTLEDCEAFGKHLFYRFDSGQWIHVHLGRYGKYRVHNTPPPKPVGLVRMRMVGDTKALDLNGPTICRVIDSATREKIVARLGPDPLAGGRKAKVWEKVRSSKKPIGALLLDQGVVAGVGNIFRAEVFFEIGLDPQTSGEDLDASTFDRLWKALLKMMRTGLKYGKIIAVSSQEAGKPLACLEGKDRFRVYGKEFCPWCDSRIEIINLASRKLYWCRSCQT